MYIGSKVCWLGVGVLGLILMFASIPGIVKDLHRVSLVRLLAQSAGVYWSDSLDNPLLCTRPPLVSTKAQTAVRSALAALPSAGKNNQLISTAYCLLGEQEAALAAYQLNDGTDLNSALQQYAILIQEGKPYAAIHALTLADFSADEWLLAVDVVVKKAPQVDPKPILKALVASKSVENEKQFWIEWLTVGSRIQQSEGWEAALAWYKEGLIHSGNLSGSLALRAGRILQTAATPRDYYSALAFYNQAIASSEFIYTSDQSNAHMFRGEVYRALPKEFSSDQALVEFDRALEIATGSINALLNKGHVYLYDLKDPTQAEPYYLQALLLDDRSPYGYYYLGEVARIRGDLEQARQYYLQASVLKPDWPLLQGRLKALAEDQ